MKTKRINAAARFTGLAVGLALFAGVAGEVKAEDMKGAGARKLLELNGRVVTPKAEASDYKAMSCPMCKDTVVAIADRDPRGLGAKTLMARGAPTTLVAKHLCDGCGVEWTTSGHGKTKVAVATHKCTGCGAESLACCNMKKDSTVATKGMEKRSRSHR
jgi:hypothetical protein